MEPTEAQMAGIQAAIRAGNKIEAIKLYREVTGAGLAESKEAVDRMDPTPRAALSEPLALSPAAGADEALTLRIRELLRAGSKIDAIKHARAATGLGLKEAKDLVEKMDAQYRTESPDYAARPASQGCLGIFLVAVGILALAVGGITLSLLRGA